MTKSNLNKNNIENLIEDLLQPKFNLKDLYNKRLDELNLTATASLELLQIQHRTLHGILEGTQKKVDYTVILKLSEFLNLSKEHVFSLYVDQLKTNFEQYPTTNPEKENFIRNNFDLTALKKDKVIDNINDFIDIETKLCSLLGINTIFEFQRPKKEAAFSSGKVQPKNELTRDFWLVRAKNIFEEINNPYEYNREGLIKFFPELRWHTTNVDKGLKNVIRLLYQLGITTIFQPSLSSLHLRGATLSVNRKPCIVITDYKGFYSTLWFALVHELFHVIFDWDEIVKHKYHLSSEENENLSVYEKEQEANNFAREYLFSKTKMKEIKFRLKSRESIRHFAKIHQVHPSIIYTFNAFDSGNRVSWAIARKENPNMDKLLSDFNFSWENPLSITKQVNSLKLKYYI